MKFENESEGPNFYLKSVNGFANRSIGLNINYRFGKLDFRQPSERGERNNDLKQDESGNMNGGGGSRNK